MFVRGQNSGGGKQVFKQTYSGFPSSGGVSGFVDCGFDPKKVMVASTKYSSNGCMTHIYDEDSSTTSYTTYVNAASYTNTIGSNSASGFLSVGGGTNGFTLNSAFASNWSGASVTVLATS